MQSSEFGATFAFYKDLPAQIAMDSTADEVCARLENVFQEFEEALKPDEEIGLALSSFGAIRQIIVLGVIACGPNMLIIKGEENGHPVSLVQHISQMNFLLIAVPRACPDEPRRKIGFRAE